MRILGRVGEKLFEPVRIEGGPKTRMIIQRPAVVDQPGLEFSYPKLVGRVRRDSIVRPGHIVEIPGGSRYLCADRYEESGWRTFHMFQCDRKVRWTRMTTKTHALTGVKQADVETDLGEISVMWERVRREFVDLSFRISQERHLVACGADVQIGDRLDDKRVDRVSKSLGVNIAEVM